MRWSLVDRSRALYTTPYVPSLHVSVGFVVAAWWGTAETSLTLSNLLHLLVVLHVERCREAVCVARAERERWPRVSLKLKAGGAAVVVRISGATHGEETYC